MGLSHLLKGVLPDGDNNLTRGDGINEFLQRGGEGVIIEAGIGKANAIRDEFYRL
jgi:hypothetical protein